LAQDNNAVRESSEGNFGEAGTRAREATVNGGINPPLWGEDNRGQCVRNTGRKNMRKLGVFGGDFWQNTGQKGAVLAQKSEGKG